MRRSLLRFAIPALAALTLALGTAPPSRAQEPTPQRLRGQITRVDGDMIYLRKPNGQPTAVLLAPDASVISITPAKLSDIEPGRFVGTAARPEPNGRWQALEVHLFPVGSPRVGEGHRPWAPEPGATMTNAEVTAAAVKAGSGTMTLSTGGQTYEFDVPKKTPIVAENPGTRAQIKKGARVAIGRAQPGAGGSYTAKRIQVITAPNYPVR